MVTGILLVTQTSFQKRWPRSVGQVSVPLINNIIAQRASVRIYLSSWVSSRKPTGKHVFTVLLNHRSGSYAVSSKVISCSHESIHLIKVGLICASRANKTEQHTKVC